MSEFQEADTLQEELQENGDQEQQEVQLDKHGKPKKSVGREVLEWVLTVAAAVAIALVIRTLVFEFVKVDGASMNDTLANNEIMYVSKPEYVFGGNPQRFDVIILHYPDRGMTNFVKRVVGLPGDTVQFIKGYLYVNGEKQDEPYINDDYRHSYITDTNEIYVPKKGDILTISKLSSGFYGLFINGEAWQHGSINITGKNADNKTLTIDNGTTVIYDGKTISGSSELETVAGQEFVIDEDYYYACGDHRDSSNDSRSIGPVRRSMIIGHVRHVVFPFNKWRSVE